MPSEFYTHQLKSRTDSPWTLRERIGMQLWELVWALLCRWTPKPLHRWRVFWLKAFGAQVEGVAHIHQRARINIPWHLELRHGCAVGDGASLYALGRITLGRGCCISQEAYLCTGTHDFQQPTTPLVTAPIVIGDAAFIAARAFVMPGVTVGEGAMVGACSVVTRDVPEWTVWAGTPAKKLRDRERVMLNLPKA